MTVNELIAELRKHPPETRVVVSGYEEGVDDISRLAILPFGSSRDESLRGLADAARCRADLGLFAASVAGSRDSSESLLHFRLHRGIHLDERRPGAFESFARDLLRRVKAEFAASPREISQT